MAIAASGADTGTIPPATAPPTTPATPKTGSAKTGSTKTGAGKVGAGKGGAGKTSAAQPGSGKPSAGKSGSGKSGSRLAVRHRLPVNITALVLVVGGVVVQLVGFVNSAWIDSPSGRLSFRGLSDWTEPGYAQAFVSWIAWLLVAVTLALGVAACIHWRWAGVFRYTGAVVGVAGALMTVAAVLVLAYQAQDHSFQVARNYGIGVYLAVLGLLATALGAAAGTGRRG